MYEAFKLHKITLCVSEGAVFVVQCHVCGECIATVQFDSWMITWGYKISQSL